MSCITIQIGLYNHLKVTYSNFSEQISHLEYFNATDQTNEGRHKECDRPCEVQAYRKGQSPQCSNKAVQDNLKKPEKCFHHIKKLSKL